MKLLVSNIPCVAFLGVAVYLLMHDHYVAGGWLIFASILAAQVE